MEKKFFSREKTFAFLKLSMISREKTFVFCCFEISKGINFREKGPRTRKTRKFLPTKVSALKVFRKEKRMMQIVLKKIKKNS